MQLIRCLVLSCAGIVLATLVHIGRGDEPVTRMRAGIIGLDTSHSVEFAKLLNNPKTTGQLGEIIVVAAYPGGSPDIPSSWDRVKGYTETLRGMGIEIVESVDDLLKRVDVVLIESGDGRRHLAQAKMVIAANKPLFIDKPMAASLADAMRIFGLAKEKHVPCFSASSLRFGPKVQALRTGESPFGKVRECMAWSSMHLEPHHPDLFWYGIHGVEMLVTVMGPGCKTVTRLAPDKVMGVWQDGRQGIFIARDGFGITVEGTKQSGEAGGFEGYQHLLTAIATFFKTGTPPVSADETLEILAFMEAADESKHQGGVPVSIESVMERAKGQVEDEGNCFSMAQAFLKPRQSQPIPPRQMVGFGLLADTP